MRKSVLSLSICLLLSLAVGVSVTGCGGKSASTPVAVTANTANSTSFRDTPLKLVSAEEGGGLCSWLINLVLDGLKEGITCNIGENTTGRILNDIEGHTDDPGASAAFQAMSAQLTQIGNQLTNVEGQINSLIGLIAINQATLTDQIDGVNLEQYSTVITNVFNTDPTGESSGTPDGYMYFATAASTLDTTNAAAVAALKSQAATFCSNNSASTMRAANTGIYKMVVPDTNLTVPVLKSYAQFIIQSANTGAGLSDSDLAMQSYKLLEQLFSQILTYQIQANIIIAELDNYKDPSGATTQGDLTTFQNELRNEVAQFLTAVNYMMINLVDYRKPANYGNESAYMHTAGIAPDDTYNMVFARSRFFVAQVLNSFQKDSGLHGVIVTPKYNSLGTNAAPPVTVKFAGYSTVTITANPTNIASRFPYTAWNITGTSQNTSQSFADNNWSFYEFAADHDLPAGSYAVTLVDNGNQNTPWYHTVTTLGTITVLYYDPSNPGAGGTVSPTSTNTFKFGSGSARWNWGYNRISMAPTAAWTVPAKIKSFYPQYDGRGSLNNPYIFSETIFNPASNFSYSPNYAQASGTTTPLNKLNITLLSSPAGSGGYELNFPFTVESATLPAGTTPSATPVATIYYNNSGDVVSNNMLVNFDVNLYDSVAQSTTKMCNYSDTSNGNFNKTVPYQGALSGTLKVNNAYDLVVDAGLFGYNTDNSHHGNANITVNWDMQVVYTNTYPLP